jgi:hypothetical protein
MITAIFNAILRWFEPAARVYADLPAAAQRRLLTNLY